MGTVLAERQDIEKPQDVNKQLFGPTNDLEQSLQKRLIEHAVPGLAAWSVSENPRTA
jgi:hypothetical protein